MKSKLIKQYWVCEACKTLGLVKLDEHADLYSALHEIAGSHKKVSPMCKTPVYDMRIINSAMVKNMRIYLKALRKGLRDGIPFEEINDGVEGDRNDK